MDSIRRKDFWVNESLTQSPGGLESSKIERAADLDRSRRSIIAGGASLNALWIIEGVRAALGRRNPYERFGAGRHGAALLDLMVGEPVAHATGSPELKARGPSRTVSNSPITKSQRGIVCGGVPQTLLFGERRRGAEPTTVQ